VSRSHPPSSTADVPGERLQKLLSAAGIASRRHAEALIVAGRVAVNGRVVRELGARADPRRDVVTVDGERLAPTTQRRTVLLHKPRGVVSTMSDPEGRPTVRDLVRALPERLYPVGRLDLQTSGLLLLTNDGSLAARLLAGEQGVDRVYEVKVDGRPAPRMLERLRRGIHLDDTAPVVAAVRVLRELPTKTWLEMRVQRGQWHVVRRLCEAVGLRVDKLVRVGFGPLRLGSLPLGAFRDLSRVELAALRQAAGLSPPASPAGVATAAAHRAPKPRGRTPHHRAASRSRARGHSGPRR
jgi:23S rRNA pseudouridine2605 synthase